MILLTFGSSDLALTGAMTGEQHIVVGSKNFMENRQNHYFFSQNDVKILGDNFLYAKYVTFIKTG